METFTKIPVLIEWFHEAASGREYYLSRAPSLMLFGHGSSKAKALAMLYDAVDENTKEDFILDPYSPVGVTINVSKRGKRFGEKFVATSPGFSTAMFGEDVDEAVAKRRLLDKLKDFYNREFEEIKNGRD